MIRLFDNDNDFPIGEITEAQLDFLQEQLIEETLDSTTFALAPATVDSLAMNGGDPEVIAVLRKALGSRLSMELRYELD
jgi:citrate lyase alpha subunit